MVVFLRDCPSSEGSDLEDLPLRSSSEAPVVLARRKNKEGSPVGAHSPPTPLPIQASLANQFFVYLRRTYVHKYEYRTHTYTNTEYEIRNMKCEL